MQIFAATSNATALWDVFRWYYNKYSASPNERDKKTSCYRVINCKHCKLGTIDSADRNLKHKVYQHSSAPSQKQINAPTGKFHTVMNEPNLTVVLQLIVDTSSRKGNKSSSKQTSEMLQGAPVKKTRSLSSLLRQKKTLEKCEAKNRDKHNKKKP